MPPAPTRKQLAAGISSSARILLLLSCIALLATLVWSARHELIEVAFSVRPGTFVAAVILGTIFMLAQGLLFVSLLGKHGGRSPTRVVLGAFLASQLGKYLPGKIWPTVLQSLALGKQQHLAGVAIANFELVVIGLLHMLALGMACLIMTQPAMALLVVATGVGLGTAVVKLPSGAMLKRLPRVALRLLALGDSGATDHPTSLARAVGLSACLVGLNLIASVAVLVAAGPAIETSDYAVVLAVFYLGFSASFLALPVPAGIGVREAAIVALGLALAPDVASATLVSVALLARLWQLATDAFCFGLGLLLLGRGKLGPTQG